MFALTPTHFTKITLSSLYSAWVLISCQCFRAHGVEALNLIKQSCVGEDSGTGMKGETVVPVVGMVSVLHRGGVLCLGVCVDCGLWNADMDLKNMNFLQMQEPFETHGWEMMIVGLVNVLDRDRVSL